MIDIRPSAFKRVACCLVLLCPAVLLSRGAGARQTSAENLLVISDRGSEGVLHLFTMKADGTGAKRVTGVDERELEGVPSADGKRIAFTVADPTNTGDIWVMNADGSRRTKLTSEPKGVQAFGPAWSPDAKRVAYSVREKLSADRSRFTLYVVDADGTHRRSFGEGLLPVWTPNGKQLLVTVPAAEGKGDPSLTLLDVDGDPAKRILRKGAMGVYSPDGKKIAFMTTNPDPNLSPDLQVMDADGSHAAPVPQAKAGKNDLIFGTRWSRDNRRIFFTRIPDVKAETAPPGMQVWQVDLAGGNPTQVTKEGTMNFVGDGVSFIMIAGIFGGHQ